MDKPSTKHSERRDLIWNVLEPGDPYDIRNSLIARLPGDHRPFMGDNIEMVCFFQAAEIQRLIQFVNEYRLKYKQLERIELDRHSYEIQIKQLTERCSDGEGLRVQVNKLKEYIRKLKQQLDEQQYPQQDEQLKLKYEEALKQIDIWMRQNSELKMKIRRETSNAESSKTKFQALEKSKAREFDQLKNTIQRRTVIDQQQLEEELTRKFTIHRNQLQMQIRRLKDESSAKTSQLEEFRTRISESNNEMIDSLRTKNMHLESNTKRYIEDIDTLTTNIRQVTVERNELLEKYRNVEGQIIKRDNHLRQYIGIINVNEQSISQLNRAIVELQARNNQLVQFERLKHDFEDRSARMSQEIERLNALSQTKVHETQQIIGRNTRLEYQLQTLRNQNQHLASRLSERDSNSRMLGELQQNLMRLSVENKRLSEEASTVRQSVGQVDGLRRQNTELKRTIEQVQAKVTYTIEQIKSQTQLSIQEYTQRQQQQAQRINELQLTNHHLSHNPRRQIQLSDLKEKLAILSSQNIQIKNSTEIQLRHLNQQNQTLKRQLDNLRRRVQTEDIGKLQNQIKQWERKSREWINEREQFTLSLANWEIKSREYENRINLVSSELLNIKNQENTQLVEMERNIRERQIEIKRLEVKLQQKNTRKKNEFKQDKYQRQNQSLKQENTFIIQKHSRLQEQISALQQNIINLNEEIYQLREGGNMIEELKVALKNTESQNEELKSKLRSLHDQNTQYSKQIRTYQGGIKELKIDNDRLKLKLLESQNRVIVEEENDQVLHLQRLTELLDHKTTESEQRQHEFREIIRSLQERVSVLTREKEGILKNSKDVRLHRQFEEAKRQILILNRELESIKEELVIPVSEQKIHQKVAMMSAEIQRLHRELNDKDELLQTLDLENKRVIMEKVQMTNINNVYTKQIEELSQDLRTLQNMKDQTSLVSEIQRLNNILNIKLNQITLLNQKLNVQNPNGEEIRVKFQETLSKVSMLEQKSMKDNQIFSSERSNLNSAIQRLTIQLNQYKRGHGSDVILRQQNDQLRLNVHELNSRLRSLEDECEMRKRDVEIVNSNLRNQLLNTSGVYGRQLNQLKERNVVEKQRLVAALGEVDALKNKLLEYSNVERRVAEYEGRINILTVQNRKIQQYQQRLLNFTQQIQLLRQSNPSQKLTELNQYKQKYSLLFTQNQGFKRQIQQLSQRIQIQTTNRTQIERRIALITEDKQRSKNRQSDTSLKQEIQRLRVVEMNLTNHLNQANRKISELTRQIERLARGKQPEPNLILEIERLNNTLRLVTAESSEHHNRSLLLERQSEAFRQEYEMIKSQMGNEDAYRRRVQETDQKFSLLSDQFQKLGPIISQLNRQNSILKQQNYNLLSQRQTQNGGDKGRVLSLEIQRLTLLVKSLEQEIGELRLRFVDQNALEKRINEHLALFVVLFAEIESLRKRVKDKEKEVDEVRRSSLAPYMH